MNVLCLVDGKNVPGSRYRFYQYVPYLEKQGFKVKILSVWPAKEFSPRQLMPKIYRTNKWLARFISFFLYILILFKRFFDIAQVVFYDVVIFQRDLFPFGPPVLEYCCKILNRNIVFDFDDAVFLKNKKKIVRILKLSKAVTAGNEYLAEFARKYSDNVYVIPTPIDTNVYIRKYQLPTTNHQPVVVGWSGSQSTLQYLNLLKSVFRVLLKKYPDLKIKILSSFAGTNFEFIENSIYQEWTPTNEITEISSFDIGIMPLPDSEWSKGKCGFKIIQYMALCVTPVASAIGMNKEIIQDGINGFLANTEQEWIEKLSILIEDKNLRKKMGIVGHQTVEKHFSVEKNLPKLKNILEEIAEK